MVFGINYASPSPSEGMRCNTSALNTWIVNCGINLVQMNIKMKQLIPNYFLMTDKEMEVIL